MRVLLKLSGESLGGPAGKGIDEKYLVRYAREIVEAVKAGHQVAVVNGGGNFFHAGLLYTVHFPSLEDGEWFIEGLAEVKGGGQ